MADTLKRNSLGIAVIGAGHIGTMRALEKPSSSLHVGYSRRFKRRYLLAKEQIVHGDATAVVCLPPPRLYPNA